MTHEPNRTDNDLLKRWDKRSSNWTDDFGNQIADRTNVLDIASHYPLSPERWTLEVDGTRQILDYGSVSQYNHTGSFHELQPAAGETVTFRTAERPRYVVQYELAATWAFSVNQELKNNDQIIVGLYDGSDGWYLEHNGSQDPDVADFVMERGGSEVYRKQDIDIYKPVDEFARLKLQTGWYDITRQTWERSYSKDGQQINEVIGEFSEDIERGPTTGNQPLYYEVTADASTSSLVLEAGSCAQVNLGRTTPLRRFKSEVRTNSITVTGSWEPLQAYRIDPDRDIVNVQIDNLQIAEYGASADVELIGLAFDKSNVKDGGGNALEDSDFSTPVDFSPQNNVFETTSNVDQVVDSTGTLQTSMSNPGGWQLARGELFEAGTGNESQGATTTNPAVKRPFYPRDYMVIMGKSSTAGDVNYRLDVEQDW
jgi:hypothetical protein